MDIQNKKADFSKNQEKKFKKEKLNRFYFQELFGDYEQMKKGLIFITFFTTLGEVAKKIFIPGNHSESSESAEKIIAYGGFLVAVSCYSLAFLKRFQGKSQKFIIIRCVLLTLANFGIFAFIVVSSYYYFKDRSIHQDNQSLMTGLAFYSTGAYIPLIVDLLNPIWYTKLIVPFGYYIGLIIGAYQMGDFYIETIVRSAIAMIDIMLITCFKARFRWKLFTKRVEDEALNKVHEEILDNVPNPIAVFNIDGKITYNNFNFQKFSKGSFENISKKIVKLKLRKDFKEFDDSDVNIEIRKADIQRQSIPIQSLTNSGLKDKPFQELEEGEIATLDELLRIFWKIFQTEEIGEEVLLIFDGKYIEDPGKNKEKLPIEYSFEVTLSLMSKYQRIILMLRDTTQQAKIIALQNNNEYKDKLLASVSHELRTPLNGNLSLIEAAMESNEIPPEITENLLKPAHRSGKLLLHLINDILDFSQIALKKLRLNFESLSIKETIKSCYQLIELQAQKKELDFQLDIDERLSEFTTDHDRLKQIILNLISNAVKFTFAGKVILKARMISKHCVKVIVKDTGIGIKKEDLPKLFKGYANIDNKEHGNINSKGVGLGLTIAYQLAKRIGPNYDQAGIKVKTQYGKGSSFSFLIYDKTTPRDILSSNELSFEILKTNLRDSDSNPSAGSICSIENSSLFSINLKENIDIESDFKRYTTRSPSICKGRVYSPLKDVLFSEECSPLALDFRRTMSPKSTNPKRKKKILVVDDEPFNILAMEFFLKKMDVNCEAAYNGKEALDKVKESYESSKHFECYDLIIMDCQMPILDGFGATKALTELMKKGELPEINIVACTAFDSKEAVEACLSAGMKEVMKKPLSKAKLEEILKTYLG